MAVTAEIGESQLELRLTTPALTALVDPLYRTARRDSCIVILDIIHPQGWQFAINSVDSRSSGNAGLAQGVAGSVRSSYFFQGVPTQATFEFTITGPYNDTFAFRSELLSGEELFGSCGGGRPVVFNNEARINPQETPAAETTGNAITVGENDMAEFVYSLLWRQC